LYFQILPHALRTLSWTHFFVSLFSPLFHSFMFLNVLLSLFLSF
jgi:hypothetical protein